MNLTATVEFFKQPGTARVEREITSVQRGRVYYEGTYWPAQLYRVEYSGTLAIASSVIVIGRQGLTLLVLPLVESLWA